MKRRITPVDHYIGQRIRSRRLTLNLSQTVLADALDLTFQQVQKYEKGTNRVGTGRLAQIARTLVVPVEWFFEGAPGAASNGKGVVFDFGAQFMSSKDGVAIASAWPSLPKQTQRAIVGLIAALVRAEDAAIGIEGAS